MERASIMVNNTGSMVTRRSKRTWMAHDERDSNKFIVEYIFSLNVSYQGHPTRIDVYMCVYVCVCVCVCRCVRYI